MTLKLCDYFERTEIKYMSVTSNHFETVELFYDCCDSYSTCFERNGTAMLTNTTDKNYEGYEEFTVNHSDDERYFFGKDFSKNYLDTR